MDAEHHISDSGDFFVTPEARADFDKYGQVSQMIHFFKKKNKSIMEIPKVFCDNFTDTFLFAGS